MDVSVVTRLFGLCRRLRVRIWHGHEYKSNLLGWLLRPLCRFHLVTTVHGWVEHSPKLFAFYAIDRWVLRRYDRVIVVSDDLLDSCRALGVQAERLRQITNAIEVADYSRRGPAKEAPGRNGGRPGSAVGRAVPAERLVIGAVGRLTPEKGFDYLITAVSRLCARGLDLELWIAGEGGQDQALRTQIEASGHGDRIHLLGFCSDTPALFECFDIFCLSSLREGLPNVLLEAMAMEVPILATRSGGIAAALADGSDCILVPPGSADALEHALFDLANDSAKRRELAAQARKRVEAEFSFRRRMDKVTAVYDELCPHRSQPKPAPEVAR